MPQRQLSGTTGEKHEIRKKNMLERTQSHDSYLMINRVMSEQDVSFISQAPRSPDEKIMAKSSFCRPIILPPRSPLPKTQKQERWEPYFKEEEDREDSLICPATPTVTSGSFSFNKSASEKVISDSFSTAESLVRSPSIPEYEEVTVIHQPKKAETVSSHSVFKQEAVSLRVKEELQKPTSGCCIIS